VNKPRNETNGTGVNNGVIKPIKNMRITNGQGYMGGKMNEIEEKRMEITRNVYVMNSPILTDWGVYSFKEISISEVKALLSGVNFVSAIGHEGTATVMSQLTGIKIPVNRISIKMNRGDIAIIFRLLVRLPEGKVLSDQELKDLPYSFGLLTIW
jgi:hypothetical protein